MSNSQLTEQELRTRIINEANHIIGTKCTIRQAALEFGVCKSTIHYDMTTKLPQLSENLHNNVMAIFRYNDSIKHLRGGETVRERYSKKLQRTRQTQRHFDNMLKNI
jgi:putative DeoR family transcriptional regulator (stage III sporulation protein D)